MVVVIGMSSSSPDASPSRQITVVDVYDLAAAIGKDFERLIEQFGSDGVRSLMPKVISALETLEALASTNERENEEITTLQRAVERLEVEKATRSEERHKFEVELEQAEENYKKEIDELFSMVKTLQLENKQLSLSAKSVSTNESDVPSPLLALKDEDLKMLLNLKVAADQQKDQLKILGRELHDKSNEFEMLQAQAERLGRQNRELQRRCKAVQAQGRLLVEEKSELISQVQDKEEHIIRLSHQLGETERARKDLEQTKMCCCQTKSTVPVAPWKTNKICTTVEEQHGMDRDNAPRFTLSELREVLQEKNHLKARVMELEEELEMLRPPPPSAAPPSPTPPTPASRAAESDEMLVYGPINKEPEEKLYPWKYQRKDSGVRKFFSWRLWPKQSSDVVRVPSRVAQVESPAMPSSSVRASANNDATVACRSYSFASSSPLAAAKAAAAVDLTHPSSSLMPVRRGARQPITDSPPADPPSSPLSVAIGRQRRSHSSATLTLAQMPPNSLPLLTPNRQPTDRQLPPLLTTPPPSSDASATLDEGSSPCSEVAVEAALTPTTTGGGRSAVGGFLLARFGKS